MDQRRVKVNGHYWYVEVCGQGPPVLFLHGFTGSAQAWQPVVERLSSQVTCITVDFLGHGQSDAPQDPLRYAMEQIVTDLETLMTTLGFPAFACVGYSMGGRTALCLACAVPNRVHALVLESASPGLRSPEERRARQESDNKLAEKVLEVGVEPFMDDWQSIPLFATQQRLPKATLARQREIRCQNTAYGLAGSLRGMGTGAQPSLWDQLNDLRMPVLLVTGDEDTKFCAIAKEMSVHLPHATHALIHEAGHSVHLERMDAYVDSVRSFFVTNL